MVRARFQIVKQVQLEKSQYRGWALCLQWGRYLYEDGNMQLGFRFIWRRPGSGALQPARGQARIPTLEDAETLIAMARSDGWGYQVGDD